MPAWVLLTALLAPLPSSPPNVLLVTIDTLRADRLGCYGYAAARTPAADRLAREGVLVEEAVVQAPQTRPSHASILTGLWPYEHGVRDNFSPPLKDGVPTLATVLKGRGYETGAFIGGYPLVAASGFARGFDEYDDRFTGTEGDGSMSLAERRGSDVVDRSLAWLRRSRSAPFLAWVHLYDPHAPYDPPAPFSRQLAQPYDGEVAYADAQVARLLAFLDERGLAGRTLVVVTADHGEGLGEHGEDEHLMFVYDSTLRVPLLLRLPGTLPAGRRLLGQYRSIDLLPTLLDLAAVPAPRTSGASRAAEMKSGARIADNEAYAESLYGQLHFGYAPLRALRVEGWKYVDAPRAELYRVRDDPGERENLIELRGQVATRLRERLLSYESGQAPATLAIPEDAGAIERLVALGYVGAGGAAAGSGGGADPKDKIAEHQAYTRDVQKALRLFKSGEIDAALPLLERLSQREGVSFEVQHLLGRAQLRKGRPREAARSLEEARRLLPRVPAVYVELAQALRLSGKPREARVVVDQGLGLTEKNPALWEEGALAALAMGDVPVAEAALRRALGLNARSLRARLALSALLRERGDLAGALAQVKEATQRTPAAVSAWNAQGVLLAALRREGEAQAAFEKALHLAPEDPDVLFHLARLHLQGGRGAEAKPLLERAVRVAPDFAEAREALAGLAEPAATAPRVALRLIRVGSRAEADAVRARLEQGADFAQEARQHSTHPSAAAGGDLGAVVLADLAEPLRSAAAALGPGARSAVLETADGFVLLWRER